ncbi:hypothetical protein ACW6QP_06980 [Salegentibacter sp. HM20]
MKQKLIYSLVSIFIVIITLQLTSFEFFLLFLLGLTLLFLGVAGVFSFFIKVKSAVFKIPLKLSIIFIIGILSSLFRPYDNAIVNSGTSSKKLEYAYKTDQKDRMQLKSYLLGNLKKRDEIRLKQAKEIHSKQHNLTPLDQFHAAFIFHHSHNPKDYETASRLATSASEAPNLQDHYQAQWLKKAAYDRWMVSIGKPEKYNTQNKFSIGFE